MNGSDSSIGGSVGPGNSLIEYEIDRRKIAVCDKAFRDIASQSEKEADFAINRK
jgi:hypothetical protein